MNKVKILNSVQFKYLLAILMVLNHIHYFFDFTGKIPKVFELIGYCVAPCFLILMVDGFQLTSNRKNYYSRLWTIAAMMSIELWLARNYGFAQRSDGFIPINGIISNFLVLFVLMLGVEAIQKKEYLKGCMILLAPFIWGGALLYFAKLFPQSKVILELIHSVIFPNVFWIYDGGISYVLPGLVAFLLRKNRNVQVIASMLSIYLFRVILLFIVIVLIGGGQFSADLIINDINICGALGFLPMLLYNGEKGKGSTKFFYYFYPLHIYVMYAISGVVYEMIYPGDYQYARVTIPMLGIVVVFAGVFFMKDYLLVDSKN